MLERMMKMISVKGAGEANRAPMYHLAVDYIVAVLDFSTTGVASTSAAIVRTTDGQDYTIAESADAFLARLTQQG
jgi:hypothetical protein